MCWISPPPCRNNPLGVKGVGELGTIGATPAVVNAVVDALARAGHADRREPAADAADAGEGLGGAAGIVRPRGVPCVQTILVGRFERTHVSCRLVSAICFAALAHLLTARDCPDSSATDD